MKYVVFYDTNRLCTVITKAKILSKNDWGYYEVFGDYVHGITHECNIFDTIEKARHYAKHANHLELGGVKLC